MLKDDLEILIAPYIYSSPSIYNKKQMEVIAQVIADRLEIDELRVGGELAKFLYKKYKRKEHEQIKKIANAIAKAKPIKLKENKK